MKDLISLFLGRGAQPVRRKVILHETVDEDGQPTIEIVEGESITLPPGGGIDSAQVVPDRFYHCGCNAQTPMGGRCAEGGCRRVSCERCHGQCRNCFKPLCLEHSCFMEAEGADRVRLCRTCYEKTQRRRRLGKAIRGLLSPFVAFDEEERK